MHEMSLAQGVLEIIEAHARTQGFASVSTIYLDVGRLANVEIEALRFALEAVLADSLAAGAQVEISELPGCARCPDCGGDVAVEAHYDPCPRCGGHRLEITSGTQLRVRELAVR